MVVLAGWGGRLGISLVGIAALTVPLVTAGVIFGLLLETGSLRLGFGPGILFWSAAFATSRLLQEGTLDAFGEGGSTEGLFAFLVYQTMVGGAFGFGYMMLYQQILNYFPSRIEEQPQSSPQAEAGA
jgi:hypothetical protein